MAAPGPNLRVRISADLSDIKQGLGLLRGELAKVKAEAAKATPDTSGWSAGIGKIRAQLGNLAGAYVGIRTLTAGVHGLADALERADRIGELALQSGMSTEALSRLAYAAQFSGINIDSLKGSIVKFSKEMVTSEKVINGIGVSTRDAAKNFRSTEDILLDLADIFAGLPDGPERAALAVKLFGRSGADLIPLLVEGKQKLQEYGDQAAATGNVISGEAAASAGEFNDNLDRLKGTLAGVANETIRNLVPAISGYAEEAAKAGQTSNFAAQGGQFLARVLKVLAAGAIIVKNVVEGLVNVLAFCNSAVVTISGTILRSFVRSIALVSNVGKNLLAGENPFLVFAKFTKSAGAAVKANLADLTAGKNGIVAGYQAMSSGVSEAASDIANVGKLFDDAAAKATTATKGIDDGAKGATPATQKLLDIIRELLGENGDKGKKSPASAKIEQIASSTALLQDSVKRAQDALDRQLEDKQISVADYYAKRVELQQRLIDLQIEQAQAELAVTKGLGQRQRLEEQLIILQRDRAEVAIDAARDQKKAEEELNKTLADGLRDRQSNITSNLSGAEGSISAQMDAGTLGYTEGERRLHEARQLALADEIKLRDAHLAYMAALDPAGPEYQAALQGLMGIDTNIANITASMQEMRQGAMDAGVNALSTFFTNIRDGAISAGEAFRQLVADFARGIYDMLAQATAKRLVSAIAGLFNKGGDTADVSQGAAQLTSAAGATTLAGGTILFGATMLSKAAKELTAAATALAFANSVGSFGSFGAAHGGGIVGQLKMVRDNINPMVFGHAPQYHGGGVAGLTGLKNKEMAAILLEGETIRTKQQEAALTARLDAARAGSGRDMVTTPIVAIGDDAIADAMAGAAGERIVLTHVRRNWRGLSRGG